MLEEVNNDIYKRQIAALPAYLQQWQEYEIQRNEPSLLGKIGSAVTAPFRWFEQNVTQPFGAAVSAGATPGLEEKQQKQIIESLPWFQRQLANMFPTYGRELAEYAAWEAPGFDVPILGRIDVKTGIETLPWLLVPSGAGIIAKAGTVAAKATGVAAGRAAEIAVSRGAGVAARTVGRAERAITYPIAKPLELLVRAVRGKSTPAVIDGLNSVLSKEVESGKPYKSVVYRGAKEGVGPVDEGLFGKGTYFSSNPKYAQTYGDITVSEIELKNPFVIKSQQEAREFWNTFSYPKKQEILNRGGTMKEADEAAAKAMRDSLEKLGYDGIVARDIIEHGDEVIAFYPEKVIKASKNMEALKVEAMGKDAYDRMQEALIIEGPGAKAARPNLDANAWNKLPVKKRVDIVKSAGLEGKRGSAPFGSFTYEEIEKLNLAYQSEVSGVIARTEKTLSEVESEISDIKKMATSAGTKLTKESWDAIDLIEKIRLSKAAGLKGKTGPFDKFTAKELEKLNNVYKKGIPVEVAPKTAPVVKKVSPKKVLHGTKDVEGIKNQLANTAGKAKAEDIIPSKPKPKPKAKEELKLTTDAKPEGLTVDEEATVKKLTELTKRSKPLRKETEALYQQEQAKRIAEYEDYLDRWYKMGHSTEAAHHLALREMQGKYPQAAITSEIESIRNSLTSDEIEVLFSTIREGTYKSGYDRLNTFTALQDLLLNNVLQRNQIAYLEKTFGSDLAAELLKKRTFGERAREFLVDLANAPRALLASGDISGLLRQGGVLSVGHPLEAVQTVNPMLRAMFSNKWEGTMDAIIRSRPHVDALIDSGLYVAPRVGEVSVRLAEREEAFMSRFMNKIPFVKASNRAYVTGLNDLRTRVGSNIVSGWEKAGIKYTQQDLKDLSQFINWATGRGTLPKALSKQGALLNTMFFSPRLIFSRLELPLSVFPGVTKSALVRKVAMQNLLTALGAGTSLLVAAKMSGGADLVLDPRSADFGKLKIGNTRLDIWTGYAQYIRFAAQLTSAQRKTAGGRTQDLNRKEVVDRFVQTKLSPAMGFINDLMKGETYLGEDFPPKSATSVLGQMYQRMAPLAVQDLIDATNQDGPLGTFASSVGLLGIGVVTYTNEVQKARNKAAQAKYGMTWDEVGRSYGKAAQLRLEQASPEITKAVQEQEKRYAASSPTEMQLWREEGQAVEDNYRDLITKAAAEFRTTGDGVVFKEKVSAAQDARRQMYATRSTKDRYKSITNYYNQPLSPAQKAQMNPGDVARYEYYQLMYGLDMYDEYGNYRYDVAEQKEAEFLRTHGQAALDYIEEYQGSRWVDRPDELKILEQAKETLRPYWQITDYIWSMYPPELKALSDQIALMERTDPERARLVLKKYPSILRARELIVRYKKAMRDNNPTLLYYYRLFYGR